MTATASNKTAPLPALTNVNQPVTARKASSSATTRRKTIPPKNTTKRTATAEIAVAASVTVDSTSEIPTQSLAPELPKVDKPLKEKKPKLVRDSFTIPKLEYLLLEQLKHRGGALGMSIKKSELIRAGIKALAALPDADFQSAVKAVPTIKTGRPSNQ